MWFTNRAEFHVDQPVPHQEHRDGPLVVTRSAARNLQAGSR